MRLYIVSDLHLEFGHFTPPPVDVDAVVLAGDISTGTKGVEWAIDAFPATPVLYVVGNHEYYGHKLYSLVDKLRSRAEGTSVHILENDRLVLGDVAFCGCTIWTDFDLFGNVHSASLTSGARMSDYRKIRVPPNYRRLRPHDTLLLHKQSLLWLGKALREPAQKTVVITHHAPGLQSVAPVRRNSELSAAYASALDSFVADSGAALWVHGHTHYAVDYTVGSTRVLSTPRGYIDEPVEGFQPDLVVEI